jgi:pimeloyl-ACP methyl ester carboxylesterase
MIAAPDAFASITLLGSGPGRLRGRRARDLRQLMAVLDPAESGTGLDTAVLRARFGAVWDSELRPAAEADGTPAPVVEFLGVRAARTCPLGLVVMGRQLLDFPDRTAELAALPGAAILVGYGEKDDAWTPAAQYDMARRLDATWVCIPGAAHSPAVEAPETTAAMLTSFWNEAENGAREHASLASVR